MYRQCSLIVALSCILFVPLSRAADVLFVSHSNPAPAADQVVISHLTNVLGHNVELRSAVNTNLSDANRNELVVISSTVLSFQLGDRLNLASVPVLVWEPWLYDDMGMTGPVGLTDYGFTDSQTTINVSGNHSLTGMLTGTQTIATGSTIVMWGIPGANAHIAARTNDGAARPVIFGYNGGDAMANGIAPARRVGFFFSDMTAQIWTATAQTLFNAAIAWALAPNSNQPPEVSATVPASGEVNQNINLTASATDDLYTSPLTATWSVDSAPAGGIVNFANANAFNTSASFNVAGTYGLRLTVSDGVQQTVVTANINITDPGSSSPTNILFVVRLPINASDVIVRDRLAGLGHNVTVVGDSASQTSDAIGQDAVIISASVFSGLVGNKFTNSAIPVMTWEAWLFDDLLMTPQGGNINYGAAGGLGTIKVTGGGPLAAGLSGFVDVGSPSEVLFWGKPTGGASVIATVSIDPTQATIFSYDVGSALVSGTAPSKRLGFFLGNSMATNWTPSGQALFDAAVAWLLDVAPPVNQPPVANAGPDRTVAVSQPVALQGSFTDDSVALPVSALWSIVSSPAGGTVNFANAQNPTTTATFTVAGEYVLQLQVDDPEFTDTDTVSFTVSPVTQVKQLLFVSQDSPSAFDVRTIHMLDVVLGHDVQIIDAVTATASHAIGKDAVIISSSVFSNLVNTKFRDVAVPVIVWESALFDDMLMTGATFNTNYGFQVSQTTVSIASPGHPIAAGNSGTTFVTTNPTTVPWGVPAPAAQVIATLSSDPTKATVFAYEAGAQMVGMVAPARRVGFLMHDLSSASWTADLQDMLAAAVAWATGDAWTPVPRIMPLGDSITFGINQTWSYRLPLSDLLTADSCRFDMVGTQDTTLALQSANPGLFDRDHEGHSGFRTDQIRDQIFTYLNGNVPDYVLIHLGTNDISQGTSLLAGKEALRTTIRNIRTRNPNVTVLLGQIIARQASFNATVETWNVLLAQLAAEETSGASPVLIVDHYTGYSTPIHNLPDQVHPNEAGDAFIANRWFPVLRPLLNSVCN